MASFDETTGPARVVYADQRGNEIGTENRWWTPLDQRLKDYLEGNRGLASYTVRNYLTDIGSFWTYIDSLGITNLQLVDRGLLRQYLNWLITDAPTRVSRGADSHRTYRNVSKAGYAAKSVARKLSALRTLFGFLVKEGDLTEDPTQFLRSSRPVRSLPSLLDYDSIERLLYAPSGVTLIGIRDRAILESLYALGLRVSELVGLNVTDVDLVKRDVLIRGKGSRERLGIFGRPAKEALTRYLEYVRPKFYHANGLGALFLNRYGGRLTQRSIQKLVQKYADQCGLDNKIHPHIFRHSFATHLLDGGADIREVQELLGHTTPTTTEIYTHVTRANSLRTYLSAHPKAKRRDGTLD